MVTYADKPWLKSYDDFVPHSLQPYPDYPLHEILIQKTKQHPDRPLAIMSARLPIVGRIARTLTYKDINDASDAFACALVDMGLQKGDRVVIAMPNSVQFLISFFGVIKAGGVVAATNPTYPKEKMKHQINDCSAKMVIVLSLFYNTIVDILPQTPSVQQVIVTNIKEYLPAPAAFLFGIAKEKKEGHRIDKRPQDHWLQDLLTKYAGQVPTVKVTKDDLCLFQYTGGTTGVSKAAMATHYALVVNTLQSKSWLFGTKDPAADERIVFLGAIPFFHAFGLVEVVITCVTMDGAIAIVPNARDIDELLDILQTYKANMFPGVPALYNAINNHPKVRAGEIDLSTVKACISGSAPLAPATKEEFERLSGGKLIEGYGMSEAPTATHGNPIYGENRVGSIGLPFPDMEMRVVSLDNPEEEVPIGEIGELYMHGPHLMKGYYNMPTETANTLRPDKDGKIWLVTGDIVRMDEDGYFYIVDRKKDMALIGGFNVYPRTIEDVLMEHPAVSEAGVAAVPHPDKPGQEALKAWIVFKPGESATEKELIAFASDRLARYEVPTRFSFMQELPRTTVGKVLRRELIQMELDEHEKSGNP